MNIIYPADYFNRGQVDEMFQLEANAFKEAGANIYVMGKAVPSGEYVYRGWMLTDIEYDEFVADLAKYNATLITSKEQYLSAHHLPNWYEKMKDLTPETITTDVDGLDKALAETEWKDFFVKDFVKSLTTQRGSIATSKQEVKEIVADLDSRKGLVGGICLRKIHDFKKDSEIRYFSYQGKILTPTDNIPEIVKVVQSKIDLPFYSIDIIDDTDGKKWLVEIGDGQVSDLKSPWDHEVFASCMLNINKKKLKFKP
jgi:hypothetical protein